MHLTRTKIDVDAKGEVTEEKQTKESKFWLSKPNWWEAQAPSSAKKKEGEKGEDDKDPDWWKDRDDYERARFALSTDRKEKVATSEDVEEKKDVHSDALVDVGLLPPRRGGGGGVISARDSE